MAIALACAAVLQRSPFYVLCSFRKVSLSAAISRLSIPRVYTNAFLPLVSAALFDAAAGCGGWYTGSCPTPCDARRGCACRCMLGLGAMAVCEQPCVKRLSGLPYYR